MRASLDEGNSVTCKEECAILMSEQIWKNVSGFGWKGARIVCVKCKKWLMKYAFECVSVSVIMRTRDDNEREKSGRS